MARRKSDNVQRDVRDNGVPGDGWKQPDKLQFINVSLNDEDKEWLRSELPHVANHIYEFLSECAERYLRITLTPDKASGRWNAIAACCRVDHPDFGKALSCRGANPVTALFGLAYADGFKDGAWKSVANSDEGLFG